MVSAETLSIELLDFLFLVFGFIAFYYAIMIVRKWDINSTSQTQYRLENLSFLNQVIIKYIFAIKLPLFLFFIWTLDKISTVLTGAMCAVGVVNATEVGLWLLILKIVNLFAFGLWLILNAKDLKDEKLSFTKLKYQIYIFLYLLLVLEIALEVYMFASIDVSKLVSCCGTVFSSSSSSFVASFFSIKTPVLLGLFYGTFIMMTVFRKNSTLYGLLNLLFIFISLLSLILFFSTYVYELPTHHCPFCILQKDYYYIGYAFYTTLFLGTFYGLTFGVFGGKNYLISSLLFNSLYVLLVSLYPAVFYMKNGVWL